MTRTPSTEPQGHSDLASWQCNAVSTSGRLHPGLLNALLRAEPKECPAPNGREIVASHFSLSSLSAWAHAGGLRCGAYG